MSFTVRNIDEQEMEFLISSAAFHGWNPGLEDASVFYNTDPNGFFIAELNGKPIGCISAVSYPDRFGFIGFYVMKQEYAGNYYGAQLGLKAIKYLQNHVVGLDGVIERIDNYRRLGFNYAYSNARYEFVNSVKEDVYISDSIKQYDESYFNQISDYDKLCFPTRREAFLKNWLKMTNAKVFIYLENKKLMGYSVIRKCLKGYKIGPLFADNFEIAESLFISSIMAADKNEYIYFDIPEVNKHAVKLTQKYNMNKVFATARMYNTSAPDIHLNKVFGITTFELG